MILLAPLLVSSLLAGHPRAPAGGVPRAGQAPTQALVRFVNLCPDVASLRATVNGTEVAKDLGFEAASHGERVPAGNAKIEFWSGEKEILSTEMTLSAGRPHGIALLGSAASPKAEAFKATWEKDRAHLLVLNASPDVGAVQLFVDGRAAGTGALAFGAREEAVETAGKHLLEMKAGNRTVVSKEETLLSDRFYGLLLAGLSSGSPKIDLAVIRFEKSKS